MKYSSDIIILLNNIKNIHASIRLLEQVENTLCSTHAPSSGSIQEVDWVIKNLTSGVDSNGYNISDEKSFYKALACRIKIQKLYETGDGAGPEAITCAEKMQEYVDRLNDLEKKFITFFSISLSENGHIK